LQLLQINKTDESSSLVVSSADFSALLGRTDRLEHVNIEAQNTTERLFKRLREQEETFALFKKTTED
jgi:hypothetical protein